MIVMKILMYEDSPFFENIKVICSELHLQRRLKNTNFHRFPQHVYIRFTFLPLCDDLQQGYENLFRVAPVVDFEKLQQDF